MRRAEHVRGQQMKPEQHDAMSDVPFEGSYVELSIDEAITAGMHSEPYCHAEMMTAVASGLIRSLFTI